jgi:hypothetical protein
MNKSIGRLENDDFLNKTCFSLTPKAPQTKDEVVPQHRLINFF